MKAGVKAFWYTKFVEDKNIWHIANTAQTILQNLKKIVSWKLKSIYT